MKKYIKPQIEVSNIELSSLLSASGEVAGSLNKTNPIKNSNEILSKEFAFEDDWGYEE